jgi:rhodanese-related sulfurtransferase
MMDNYIRSLGMKEVANSKISIDDFIKMFNDGEVILLDVRYPFEHKVWGLPFSVNIPLNELPDRLDELPNDKMVIVACPKMCRSNIAHQYLSYKGLNVKLLYGGLLELMERLKGGEAKGLINV